MNESKMIDIIRYLSAATHVSRIVNSEFGDFVAFADDNAVQFAYTFENSPEIARGMRNLVLLYLFLITKYNSSYLNLH